MYLEQGKAVFFATDLTNFIACRHLIVLGRLASHAILKRPFLADPVLDVLRERGLEHERAYVTWLAGSGRRIVELERRSNAFDLTLEAMRSGADAIV